MPSSSEANDLPLFRDAPDALPPVSVQPWRSMPADAWTEEEVPPAPAIERHLPDLVRRNLEFLRAMELHGKGAMASEIRSFREGHEELIRHLVRWRAEAHAGTGHASLALETLRGLAELRRRILAGLDPGCLRRVMAAETRVRVRDLEVERAISIAEFELAEERGEVVAMELPANLGRSALPGVPGPNDVEVLVQSHMESMRAEQERRRLPVRGGLRALLRDLPVVWLDAVWKALDLAGERPRHRKERERRIADHLAENEALGQVVAERLSDEERRLLTYLLGRGGRASAGAVTQRFGSDRGDGWFWNEEPPTSVLGRVRLHGLAFVGKAPEGRGTRTVVVPRELRGGLEEALAVVGDGWEEETARDEAPSPPPPPALAEALKGAFPDDVIEVLWDESEGETIYEHLRHELATLSEARILYERTMGGEESWLLGEDGDVPGPQEGPEWPMGNRDDLERSYGLFFLTLPGREFRFEMEGEFPDEEGKLHPTTGVGRIGYAVAVSAIAPFALLRVTSLDSEEWFGTSSPDIESRFFDDAGRPQQEEHFLLELLEEEAKGRLDDLKQRVMGILAELGITPLSEEEVRRRVPWLEAADGVLVGGGVGAPPTVEEALFFRYR